MELNEQPVGNLGNIANEFQALIDNIICDMDNEPVDYNIFEINDNQPNKDSCQGENTCNQLEQQQSQCKKNDNKITGNINGGDLTAVNGHTKTIKSIGRKVRKNYCDICDRSFSRPSSYRNHKCVKKSLPAMVTRSKTAPNEKPDIHKELDKLLERHFNNMENCIRDLKCDVYKHLYQNSNR